MNNDSNSGPTDGNSGANNFSANPTDPRSPRAPFTVVPGPVAAKQAILAREREEQEKQAALAAADGNLVEILKLLIKTAGPKARAVILGSNSVGLTVDVGPAGVQAVRPLLREAGRNGGAMEEDGSTGRNARILVVEDDKITRTLLRKVLEKGEFTNIAEATNGQIAWDLLHKGLQPDLCILDVMMPEMTGIELLQKLRTSERFQTMPVIICTVVSDRDTIKRAASMQVDYILKPFSAELLLDKVRRALSWESASIARRLKTVEERYGLDPDEYMARLSQLAEEVEALVATVRRSLAIGQGHEALRRIKVFRGDCLKIGEERICEIVDLVDFSIQGSRLEEAITALELLEGETVRITGLVQAIWRNYLRTQN